LYDNGGLYNGNIAWMNTHLRGINPGNELEGNQAMFYRYDQLNRIRQARSMGMAFRIGEPEPYDCDYAYDANGNLLTLKRRDENAPDREGRPVVVCGLWVEDMKVGC
jgi:hypothetical protein